MLASLLPGLRQLRAPLAAGFVWLVVAWLVVAPAVPRPAEATSGIFRDVYDLAAVGGPTGVSAAAVFSAYLLGLLSVQASAVLRTVRSRVQAWRSGQPYVRLELPPPSGDGRDKLTETVVRELVDRSSVDDVARRILDDTRTRCGEARSLDDREVRSRLVGIRFDIAHYVDKVVADLQLLPLRLIDDEGNKDLYSEFDRRRAESEFRAAVALPLVALAAVLAVRVSPWFAVGLLLPAVLAVQSHSSAESAADVLAESIRAQLPAPRSPALDEVRTGAPVERDDDWMRDAVSSYPLVALPVAIEVEKLEGPDAAEHLYEIAAKAGDATAMMWLAGRLHLGGDAEAERWYRDAARAGNPEAKVVTSLEHTFSATELDAVKRAYTGEPAAMTAVADALRRQGRVEEATRWYRTAVEADHEPARGPLVALYRATNKPRQADYFEPPDQNPEPAGDPAVAGSD